jgi:hypothetical protein
MYGRKGGINFAAILHVRDSFVTPPDGGCASFKIEDEITKGGMK